MLYWIFYSFRPISAPRSVSFKIKFLRKKVVSQSTNRFIIVLLCNRIIIIINYILCNNVSNIFSLKSIQNYTIIICYIICTYKIDHNKKYSARNYLTIFMFKSILHLHCKLIIEIIISAELFSDLSCRLEYPFQYFVYLGDRRYTRVCKALKLPWWKETVDKNRFLK